jgi:hypothetical protein
MKTQNKRQRFNTAKIYLIHFLENARNYIDRLRIENKIDPRIIEGKNKSLNLIEEYVISSTNYIKTLENNDIPTQKIPTPENQKTKNYFKLLNRKDPAQREAVRYNSIQTAREIWPELY